MISKTLKSRLPQRLLACLILIGGFAGNAHLAAATAPVPGEFIWHDLVTTDAASAQKFYPAVFGWTVTNSSNNALTIQSNGANIGTIHSWKATDSSKPSAQWISAISTSNSSSTESKVKQLGGTVLIAEKAIADKGTQTLYRDPQGAIFSILQADSKISSNQAVKDNDFFWQDLFTNDVTAASNFYQSLFDYEVYNSEKYENLTRTMLSVAGFARAGIAPMPDTVKQPGWLPYVLVADVADTANKAVANGGKILVAPQTRLLNGNLAVVADPQGAIIGLINWVPEQQGAQP